MKISGIHFIDKHCWHLKITDYYKRNCWNKNIIFCNITQYEAELI